MSSRLGSYVAHERLARRLTPQQLAAAIGYTNLGKGANRILALERDGVVVPGLLDKIVAALDLDARLIRQLLAEDQRQFEDEWNQWANEPVEPELRFRALAAVWCREALPVGLSRDAAVAHAKSRAVERRLTYVLLLSRREEIWCYATGETYVRPMNVGDGAGPVTRLRGRGERAFLFG